MATASNDMTSDVVLPFTRLGDINSSTFDQSTGEITYVLATDTPVASYRELPNGKRVPVMEVLNVDGCVNLDRVGETPLLDTHDRGSVFKKLGRQRTAKVEGGKFVVTAIVSDRPDVKPLWTDIAKGILHKTSIGFSIVEQKVRKAEPGKPIVVDVTKWTLDEGSLCSVPADINASVRADVATPMPAFPEIESALAEALAMQAGTSTRAQEPTGATMTDAELQKAIADATTTFAATIVSAVRSAAAPATPPAQTPPGQTPPESDADKAKRMKDEDEAKKREKDEADAKARSEAEKGKTREDGGDDMDDQGRKKRSAEDLKSIETLRLAIGSKADAQFEALVSEGFPMATVRSRAFEIHTGVAGETRVVTPPKETVNPGQQRSLWPAPSAFESGGKKA